MGAYQATGDTAKTYDAANGASRSTPTTCALLFFLVYVEKQQAGGDQAKTGRGGRIGERGRDRQPSRRI